MDPISLAILVAIGLYILAAPDQVTASLRSGAASAIGSGARAARQSISADMQSAAARRSAKHAARLKRWADRDDRRGRLLLRLDRIFGRGGLIESAGRRIGAHGKAALDAARVDWADGRSRGQQGLPPAIRQRLDPIVARIRSALGPALATALATARTSTPQPGTSSGQSTSQPTAAGTNGGNTNVAQNAVQPINTEAGLLPVAEQIATATAELAALIEAATASENLPESLKFDPGAEVKAAMAGLAGATPSPDSLRAWGEAAIGFKEAVEEHVTAVVGA